MDMCNQQWKNSGENPKKFSWKKTGLYQQLKHLRKQCWKNIRAFPDWRKQALFFTAKKSDCLNKYYKNKYKVST